MRNSASLPTLSTCTNNTEESVSLALSNVRDDDNDLRVLIYTTCYNVIDGVTLTIRKLENEILNFGGQVCILTTRSGKMSNTNLVPPHPNRQVIFIDDSLRIPFLEDARDPTVSYELGMALSPAIQKQLDEYAPSIIHITAPDCTALHLINYARSRKLPLMGTYHSNIPDYMLFIPGLRWIKPILECFIRHIYNFFQTLYVTTPFIKLKLIQEQQMDKVTDVQVWGRGVDLLRFSPTLRTADFRTRLGIDQSTPIILYVGRLVPEKRPDIFATVVRRLAAENISFRAIVVGAGPAIETVEDLPNTLLLGWLDGNQLSEAYASSDVFLFPSSVETFGNVTLEAAASGLPLVVESLCSGHLVNHGVNGYLCQAGDVDAFYEATKKLVLDHDQRQSFSLESVKLSQTMEVHTVVSQMITNYQQVINEFYTKYKGSHQYRDELYQQEGSFYWGSEPHPFGYPLVEFVFTRSFKLVICIMTFFEFLLSKLRFSRQKKQQEEVTEVELSDALLRKTNNTTKTTNSGTNSHATKSLSASSASSPQLQLNSQCDDYDIEEGKSSAETSLTSDVSEPDEDDSAKSSGCVACMISIGDAERTTTCVNHTISAFAFSFRTASATKRAIRKCACNSAVIEHRVDALRKTSMKRSL
jgi:glycosyltransferase involved in cell wall biosynthesis